MRNKLPAERNIGVDIDSKVIEQWRNAEPCLCELINDDVLSFLMSFPFNGNELIYVDPPYVHSTRKSSRIYRHEYTDEDHQQLLEKLLSLPCKVMISGYDNPLYAEVLSSWHYIKFNAKTHTGIREESVWMNYAPPTKLHDSRYLGNNYRERQTVARRRSRLYNRIDKMEPIERGELIQWLNSKYGQETA
ncbi:DNA adenine methylase [Pantoea ananatis]